MEQTYSLIYANTSFMCLSGLIAAALFFLVVGLREFHYGQHEGLLYVALGLFFFAAHFYFLMGLPESAAPGSVANLSIVWHWLADVFAPAIIALYLLIGLYNFLVTQARLGLTKIFFGLSLSAFLYWLGLSWAIDIKGVLTIIWTIIWFDVELETAH